MNGARIAGLVLLVLGILGLAYGRFTYTKDRDEARLGPISIAVEDKKTVNVPMWAGVAAIIVGAGLMLVPPGKRLT
jgi:uncharacterized membrane protein